MRYKVGDKVRVKSRDWYEKNQIDGEVDCGGLPFTSWLADLCGTTQIIEVVDVCAGVSYYRFENVPYLWNDLMLEGTADFPLEDDKALELEMIGKRVAAGLGKNSPDYWTHLKHQYAGMAMQTLMPQYEKMYNAWVEEQMEMNAEITPAQADKVHEDFAESCADLSVLYAEALVKKLK